MIPIGFSHLGVVIEIISSLVVASFVLGGLGFSCDVERVLDPSAVMNVLVVLEYDVEIEFGVVHVVLNPPSLQLL